MSFRSSWCLVQEKLVKSYIYFCFFLSVITINGGFQYVQANNNVTLTWRVSTTDFNVFRPNGLIIDKSQLNVTTVDKGELIVNAVLTNVTSRENGTYICSSNNNTRRNGLTVIVLGIYFN